jgi:CelD/BcsL family acetyltransferase involved in cellulose biosynthesis
LQYSAENVDRLAPAPFSFSEDKGAVIEPKVLADARVERGGGITAEIADISRLASLRQDWDDLVGRAAEPNAFMDPVLLRAAAENQPQTPLNALLAWKAVDGRRQLAGLWAFSVGRPRKSPLPLRVLSIPPYFHGHLATPVVDRESPDATLDAMLEAIAAADLPKVLALETMGTEGPTMEALARVLAARNSAPCHFQSFRRPKLASDLDGKRYLEQSLSSSSRKKLRQHRRRLAEMGTLKHVIASEPDEVGHALENFLMLEAAGWKGRQGTAFLCDRTQAAFIRSAVVGMASARRASVHTLCLDARPVSVQIVIRCGEAAFTWKTTYDEQFQDFSPGMLLLEDYTAAFLVDAGIAFVDSCAYDDTGFMSAWSERQSVADLWLDARRGGSFAFRLWSNLQRNYRDLRGFAKDAYHARRQPQVPVKAASQARAQ